MQLLLGTRGHIDEVEHFIRDLRGIKFVIRKDGKEHWLPLGVRPWQFWELAFPEEYLPQMIQTLHMNPPEQKFVSKYQTILRKILKLKKIS